MDLDNFENQGNKGRQYTMTIKEIAQMAGVSSAAVSRYLNGGYVSEQKKEQIRKVIEKTSGRCGGSEDQFRINQPDYSGN